MWIFRDFCLLLAVSFLILGCNESHEGTPSSSGHRAWFSNEQAERGVTFRHESGALGDYLLPEITGGGVALFDMDSDNDLDLYMIQSGPLQNGIAVPVTNELYRNDGNGYFSLVNKLNNEAFDSGYGMGVVAGDYDSDGDADLFVTNLGPNKLLRNDGTGHFTDVTDEAIPAGDGWSTAAVFLDLDRDSDLDLFVTDYLHWSTATFQDCYTLEVQTYCLPSHNNAASDSLYLNNGDGSFTDISAAAGLDAGFGNGLGAVAADFNGDGWSDIFVANDGMVNQLWLNNGDRTFTESASAWSCAMDDHGVTKAGMGIVTADQDFDGDFDVLVVNIQSQTDSFFRNEGTYFSDATSRIGLSAHSRRYTRFGVLLEDFNNDGFLDLYEANGKVYHGPEDQGEDVFAEPNTLYMGTTAYGFKLMPDPLSQNRLVHTSRGAAVGDINGDGKLDIVVANRDARPYLLINRTDSTNNWIRFRLIDEDGKDSLGSELSGNLRERSFLGITQTAGSYLASSQPEIHVGLGDASELTDIVVSWTNGERESFGSFPANQTHVLQQGSGVIAN